MEVTKVKNFKKIFLLGTLTIFMILGSVGCAKKSTSTSTETPAGKVAETNTTSKNPLVTIEMEDGAIIKAELYPDKAPNTVNNFISLINKGFYNGLTFHRFEPGFVIQGGDPNGTGTGGPGYSIKGEFASNKFTANTLKHERGMLSMARSQANDSAGSQFFIMVKEAPHLDGSYAAFGKVTEGMDVVDKLVTQYAVNSKEKVTVSKKMKKVTVDTFGKTYPEPEKVK
jgi:peptidyl-prolyl cis-trans isomerase B (cyclophilin B)